MRGKNVCVKCGSNKDVFNKIKDEFYCCDCLNKYSLWEETEQEIRTRDKIVKELIKNKIKKEDIKDYLDENRFFNYDYDLHFDLIVKEFEKVNNQ